MTHGNRSLDGLMKRNEAELGSLGLSSTDLIQNEDIYIFALDS